MVTRTFEVWYKDELLFRGRSGEIEKHFKLGASHLIYYAEKNRLWHGLYTIKVFREEGRRDSALWDILDHGKIIFTGTVPQIKARYGLKSWCASHTYKLGYKLLRKYDIQPHLTEEKKQEMGDPLYDQTVKLLNLYHNAYLRKDGKRVQQKLKENGILTNLVPTSDKKGCVLWQV